MLLARIARELETTLTPTLSLAEGEGITRIRSPWRDRGRSVLDAISASVIDPG